MEQKIIFFDIDGTLLSETTHTIPDSTKVAIKKARDNGHLLFINTGRTNANIDPLISELEFDGYVCGCGTYISYRGTELLTRSFSYAEALELVKDVHNCKVDAILEGKTCTFFDEDEKITHPEVKWLKDFNRKHHLCEMKSFSDESLHFDKFVIWLNKDSDFDRFYEKYGNTFDFIQRSEDFYEIVPIGYSKATGIEFLINHLGIPIENTYALGDSTNDLAMLEYVKNSIAMGNSNPVLFNKVSYITSDIEEDGVYNALKHYGII